MKNIIVVTGKKPGLTSVVIAGNHGDEICGMKAFDQVLSTLEIEYGTVMFIWGNPGAIEKGVRFISYNLNRLFGSTSMYSNEIRNSDEYKRAREIQKILDCADAVLDIHSTKNKSEPFIICEENANHIVNKFPREFKRVVYGFDEVESGAIDGYMFSRGKVGICIECGQHADPKAVDVAVKAVYTFLCIQKHIHARSLSLGRFVDRQYIKMHSLYRSMTDSFVLARKFYDFEKITKGDVIGIDGGLVLKAPSDGVIVFAHDCNKIGEEAYLLGYEVSQVRIATFSDLQAISVVDIGEEMVNISRLLTNCICEYQPQSSDMIQYVGEELWVRKSVAEKLGRVASNLESIFPGYRLKIVYGYRHLEIQTNRFLMRKNNLRKIHTTLSEDELDELANVMTAHPLTAGHPTGGAVDLTIVTPDGDLDMGSAYADFSDPERFTMFSKTISETQMKNRMLLHNLMVKEGFAPYYGEWWHYSFGDKEWAWFYKKPHALYSQINFSTI